MGRKNRMEKGIKVKVLISADAEGITRILKKSQVTPDRPNCGQLHSPMAHDANATIRGAFAGRVTEVVVNDSHNYDDNTLLVGLDSWANLMSDIDKPLIMAEESAEQVDTLILVGYHSRRGARGVASHTHYYPIVVDAAINGVPFRETEFVSHTAGYYGVPAVLLTGDNCATTSVEKQIPGVHTAMIKEVIGNGNTQLYCPEKTGKLIEKTAKAAVSEYRTIVLVKLEGSMTLTITFAAATQAVHACEVSGFTLSKRQDNTISYICDDYLEPYRAFLDVLWQAAAFNDQC